jgi:phosphoserine phosphatase RsbX
VNLTVAHRVVAREGEHFCGDAVLCRNEGDLQLLAVVDGLGHGPAAAEAAARAVSYLERTDCTVDIEQLVQGLHDGLGGSRGAAALVCIVRDGRLTACGVGNVQLRSMGGEVPVVLTAGILGVRLRRLRTFGATLRDGQRLVVHTDGVSSRFDLGGMRHLPAEETCEAILHEHRHSHDDATILVADVSGRRSER